ncbi:MAG: HIT domain-containing protein [Candidatus Wildermuthbacteria bacterium]|nr:HIT domain-containing protein [Candidatus Wildermuthbacteria bacterium]
MGQQRDGDLVDTTYAQQEGGREYLRVLQEAEKNAKCPFCPDNLSKGNTVVYRVADWSAIRNRWPYPNAAAHYLLIPDMHITDVGGVGGLDWGYVQELIRVLRQKDPSLRNGGGLALRFGTNSGVTVRHLHFHLVAPVVDPSTGKVYPGKHVDFPVG